MNREIYKAFLAQSKRYPPLSGPEEAELSKRIHAGDESARQKLVLSNLRLVVSIARKYFEFGLPLMDLIQEGNLGLTIAASKYHYGYNTRFSTYAYSWISQYIARYVLGKSPLIAIPHRKTELLRQIKYAQDYLFQQSGNVPATGDVARYLNLPEKTVDKTMKFAYSVASLDSEQEANSGATLGDFISDVNYLPETQVFRRVDIAQLRKLLAKLSRFERRVITLRYNLDGRQKKRTLREIGTLLGISAEAVRQAEQRSLVKLRGICKSRGIEMNSMIA